MRNRRGENPVHPFILFIKTKSVDNHYKKNEVILACLALRRFATRILSTTD